MLLLQAQAPQNMWADALHTAFRLLNLTSTKGKSSTPYELLFGRQPSVHYLEVFGCLACIKIPDKAISILSKVKQRSMDVCWV